MKLVAVVASSALAVIAGAALAMPGEMPGHMSVATFLEKAERLEKKGAMALFSSDMKLLQSEAQGAGKIYRARIKADHDAGRPPHSCPPPKAGLNSKDLLAHLRSYPLAARTQTTMDIAMADLMKKRYPCR